jgi:endonuclease-3
MERSDAVVKFLKQRYGADITRRWYRDPFKVLIGCVLSQRTREENTDAACKALFTAASTPEQILGLPTLKLQRLIKPVGFAKKKALNIKRICRILLEKCHGKVPADREPLLELPGVGPKTADVTLCYAFGQPCIPVDTHVNRISKRLGLVEEEVKLEQVGDALQKIFPKGDWRLINRGFVLFGREICLPRNPKCGACPLKVLCRFGIALK